MSVAGWMALEVADAAESNDPPVAGVTELAVSDAAGDGAAASLDYLDHE